jgi:hypothetical protein
MIDHARIDRHFAIELSVAMATADMRLKCKALTEHSNRKFGQMIRQHEARMKPFFKQEED